MDSPDDWRWVWIAATAVFAVGEMTSPGSFFLAPFAVGAFVAAILAFAGVSVPIEWAVFLVVSIATLIILRPVARRLDRDAVDHGVGSRRLVGTRATVLRAIPGHDELGMVRLDREEWRAQSTDGSPIPVGATVRVADVQGTRVMVVIEGNVSPVFEPATPERSAPERPSPEAPSPEVSAPEAPSPEVSVPETASPEVTAPSPPSPSSETSPQGPSPEIDSP